MRLTTEELIERIHRRIVQGQAQYETDRATYDHWYPLQDPAYRAIEARSFAQPNPLLTPSELLAAETQLGFALPPLLRQLYTSIGDGGFGPAYGMYGLLHAHPTHQGATLLSLYQEFRNPGTQAASEEVEDELDDILENWKWPDKLVPLCDWGGEFSCMDCTGDEAPILRFQPDGGPNTAIEDILVTEAVSLHRWLEAWIGGSSYADREKLRPEAYQIDDEP